jgi:hypothetical protein
MFTSQLSLHYTGSTNATETHNDQTTAVTHVRLVLDSLTPKIAKEISPEFYASCFTKDGQIHDHVSKLTIRLRKPQQAVAFRVAEDVDPLAEMRNVRIPTITITKRGEEKDEEIARKSRKVAPTSATLRATLNCLMLPDSNTVRDFLCRMPGNTFLVDLDDEDKQLDFGPDPEEDDEDDEDDDKGEQLALPTAPAVAPRLAKAITANQIVVALETQSLMMQPADIKLLSQDQRTEILAWADACHAIEKAKGKEVRTTDLPPAPAYVLDPKLLRGDQAPAPDPEAGDVLDEVAPPRERAARRSSKKFTNTPRKVKEAKAKKTPKAADAEVKH